MPTLIEITAYSLVGGATVVSLYRLAKIWRMTRREALKFKLEMDTSTFTETIERLGQDMQREIEQRIGDMSMEDIVRALMGRRLADELDEELMTGVEGTTETIPPGAGDPTISGAYTTTHSPPPEVQYRQQIEREATRIMANGGGTWEECLLLAEENHTIQGTGPQDLAPLLDWMDEECRACEQFHAGEMSNRDQAQLCGLGTPNRCPVLVAWEETQPSLDQVLGLEPVHGQAPLLEWMVESCRECSQFIMMNTTIDDSEQAILCGEGSNLPCAVFGNYFDRQQRADPDADPPPILYVWMDDYMHDEDSCIQCHNFDLTHDLHSHALACHQCRKYVAWYRRGGARQIPQGHELVEPEAGPGEGVVWRPGPGGHLVPSDDRGGMEVPPEVAEHVMDLAPSDVQTDARYEPDPDPDEVIVPPRCPWMAPAFCDPCEGRRATNMPEQQAVVCWRAQCQIFQGWRQSYPRSHHLRLVHEAERSARACNLVRVIRFKKR